MKTNYKIYLGFVVVMGFIMLMYHYIASLDNAKSIPEAHSNISYSIEVLQDEGNWLYEIYRDSNLYIRQEYVPAVHGKQRFVSEKDAKLVAQLVVEKLNNQQLPLVTKEELIDRKITFQPN